MTDRQAPLSCSQERLWFVQRLRPGIRAYQFQARIDLAGHLDAAALARALNDTVSRHEIYRTTFADGPAGPYGRVHPPYPVELPVDDLRGAADPEAAARAAIAAEIDTDLPVDRLPLVRWRLLRLADDRHVLLHLEHHLIHDGWSFNVFVEELCALYAAHATGAPSPLPAAPPQFADFTSWQRAWLHGPEAERQLAYWTNRLAGVPPYLNLRTDRPRTPRRRFLGDAPRFALPASLADRARALARGHRVSLFTVLLAAFEVLLHAWSGQDDFCVASGMAARGRPETHRMLGMVVNTVALRADVGGDPSFGDLLGRVRDTTLGALAHQDLPFDRVVAALRPPRTPGRQPLSEVLFSFHDAPLRPVRMPGLTAVVTPGLTNGSAKADLNVIAIPHAEQSGAPHARAEHRGIELIWEYDRDLFDATTIARAAAHYAQLLDTVTADPRIPLSATTPLEAAK
ncbi:condensation domain-containing protein [Streptomyces sp. NBC_00557]|uniref:condensation domain-containing protein n=1 Tax=Streptomyces sp. NBC_00557 TaxID=2975776 RepID=UPI002E7FEF22|nr:condensation domain-containing protein [Streptomyces sp. NBC_00557]WUC40286.1 condensation domain-containing protein [Streptomyces sp. NBC_00557]